MADRAIVVGSGAGAAVASMVLTHNGWDVLIFEKGPKYIHGYEKPGPIRTTFSSDELKASRKFEIPDPLSEPRTFRAAAGAQEEVGEVNPLSSCVGGGTVHWDAKTPRFWDIDFKKKSMLGPYPDTDVEDWPFEYADIAPHYKTIERLMGVAGAQSAIPHSPVLKHAPGERGFVMPPGPQQLASTTVAGGCTALGLHPYAFPMAINSRVHDGRPPCNNCGQCSSYGCPIGARIGALAVMRHAVNTGRVEIRDETIVDRVVHNGKRATGVHWIDKHGKHGHSSAKLLVLAASAIETSRLAHLSNFPDPHDRIGRDLMFHNFMDGFGIFLDQRMHAYRGRSTTQCCEDFADPDFPGSRAFAKSMGLPYIRGGIMELGGSQEPIAEGNIYTYILGILRAFDPLNFGKPFGTNFKTLMRASILRDRLAGISHVGEDLPYATNRVDLDPKVKDFRGVPVPRITYSMGAHEQAAIEFFIPHMTAILKAAGASMAAAVPESVSDGLTGTAIPHGAHVMGGMRMGHNPKTSVTDGTGMVHGMENVFVADGSVFPSSGAQNPTLTIMATALRNATKLFGDGHKHVGQNHAHHHGHSGHSGDRGPLPSTGSDPTLPLIATATLTAGLAAARLARHDGDNDSGEDR
ncbi:MAG: GMC family oxidoreductase [Frankiaceae bacterium]|nr:GMC family oxidoreductase [Frankiaceae bacterium]MBV9870097.1 GMC family oxidoreductase [Frankiaceae bacterium]